MLVTLSVLSHQSTSGSAVAGLEYKYGSHCVNMVSYRDLFNIEYAPLFKFCGQENYNWCEIHYQIVEVYGEHMMS